MPDPVPRREVLGIERQKVLKPLKPIEDKQACQAEHQHGRSVGCPVLLLMLVNAAYPIDQSLQRAEYPTQENPLSGEYLGHVDPERLGHRKQNQKIYYELQESVKGHRLFSTICIPGSSPVNDENPKINPSPLTGED